MLDYIIVGAGLSGIAVAESLLARDKKILVFDDKSQASSTVAGGIYNPVILKRFTLAWNANEQLDTALTFYNSLEKKLDISLIQSLSIYRRFHSIEEQNNWFSAMDKPYLSRFLDEKLVASINPHIPSSYSFGHVNETGVVNTELLLEKYRAYLIEIDSFQEDTFDFQKLEINGDHCIYKNWKARKIIFCDGFGLKNNPYFNYLPLNGNKGEYLIIKAEDLKLEVAVKSSVFIIPLGEDLYKVGATYNNWDKTKEPTQDGKNYLLEKLNGFLNCDFEVVDQIAGIRPATNDRKPLVGKHPVHESLYCCNGFGSRGVLIGPTVASQLIAHIEDAEILSEEIDIERFKKLYQADLS
ncbi:glycine/D-amino acid oxidase-like deaminating enzyme [Gillisia mitskevichiae]|uniref:Glycine/D-amino acid oxidase-like deaminating enzyme n=1 Tax=Gillisia mitskevichiae TaxID=270921 RepID=A0A495PZP8_9FLAO|nr:FAD-dependent oxidoreductase [Gillisia mitskevichiae]RKS56001.1 glycine/D-amino acid oxidase-like deaminating enzyme [Gillisia mitskevichiae]